MYQSGMSRIFRINLLLPSPKMGNNMKKKKIFFYLKSLKKEFLSFSSKLLVPAVR